MARVIADEPVRTEQHLKMSYEEYLALVDETTHSEWVDGEVTIFMPPADRHQEISNFLSTVVTMFLAATRLGTLRYAPFEMKLRGGRSYREPDILVLLAEHLGRKTERRLEGPADVVFELVSPDSSARDRHEKVREYKQAGIPEYWLVEARPGHSRIDVYALNADGYYEPVAADAQGRLHSRVLPDFWLDLAWFAGDELPNEIDALCAILPSLFGAERTFLTIASGGGRGSPGSPR